MKSLANIRRRLKAAGLLLPRYLTLIFFFKIMVWKYSYSEPSSKGTWIFASLSCGQHSIFYKLLCLLLGREIFLSFIFFQGKTNKMLSRGRKYIWNVHWCFISPSPNEVLGTFCYENTGKEVCNGLTFTLLFSCISCQASLKCQGNILDRNSSDLIFSVSVLQSEPRKNFVLIIYWNTSPQTISRSIHGDFQEVIYTCL